MKFISNKLFYKLINGYSNQYWGWGCEDEDLSFRLLNANMKIQEAEKETGRFTMIQHKRDRGNFDNFGRFYKLMDAIQRQYHDGISNIQFKIREIDEQPTFTHIIVNIGSTDFGSVIEKSNFLPDLDQNIMRKAQKKDEDSEDYVDNTVRVDEVWKFLLTSVVVCCIVVISQILLSKFERSIEKTRVKFFDKLNDLLRDFKNPDDYRLLKSTITIPRKRKPSETHKRYNSLPRNLKLSTENLNKLKL